MGDDCVTNLKQLIDLFSECDGVHISVTDVSGITACDAFNIPRKNSIHAINFCDTAKKTPHGYDMCIRCKVACNRIAKHTKKPFDGMCVFGQHEIVYPVCKNQNVLCIIYIGNIILNYEKSYKKLISSSYKSGGNFKKMAEQMTKMHKTDSLDKYYKMAEFIADYIVNHYTGEEKNISSGHRTVNLAVGCIQRKFMYPVTLKNTAKAYFVNEKYLGRIFKKYTGMSFHEYLLITRLNAAKSKLEHTNMSIVDISTECGFCSSAYFGNVFKKKLGCTPNEYRKQFRQERVKPTLV